MKIEFGWHLDRAPWAYSQQGLNRIRVGKKNFTALLQTRLGITRPDTGHAERVSQYLERLRSVDSPGAWFHDSFEVDPWSTAQELLAARDDAVANGWDGSLPERLPGAPEASPLLQTLAAAESAPGRLASSLADDIAELVTALDSPLPLGVQELILQHPESTFPRVWQLIIGKLRERGVKISEAEPATWQPRLTLLSAETEWEAAEHSARWLAARGNHCTAVVASAGTAVLDQYLAGHGLPAVGAGTPSVWRPQDQLIPLFFEVIWSPPNVQLLAELLTLPGSPVRGTAARHLLEALKQEPGTGGEAWTGAISAVAADPQLGPELATTLNRLFCTDLLIEDENVSGMEVAERGEWLAGRLRARASKDDSAKATASLLQRILALVTPLPRVSRRDLRRIIAAVITASQASFLPAEAAPWLRLNHLAELNEGVEQVLWWGFQSSRSPSVRRWDVHDVQTLGEVGVYLPTPEDLSALEVRQTLTAAGRAKDMVLVQIEQCDGERVDGNPLLEALAGAHPDRFGEPLAEFLARVTRRPEDLTDATGRWSLASRRMQLVAVPQHRPDAPPAVHQVGPNPALVPDRLSFTQLSTLLGCSLAWVLKHKSRLTVPAAASVPSDNQMLGLFAHKVTEVLQEQLRAEHRAVPGPEEVRAAVELLMPQLASELLLPGQKSRRAGVQATIATTVMTFFEQLQRGGVVLQEMEKEFVKDLHFTAGGSSYTVEVRGRADAVGIDAAGRTAVVDLKWTNSDKYRREEVQRGEALQLALYQWALSPSELPPDAPTAYFMLKQGSFVSGHPEFGSSVQPRQDPSQLWTQAVRAIEFTVEEVLAGRITATEPAANSLAEGEPGADAAAAASGRLHMKPNCRYCDFGTLCGLKGDYS